MNAILWKIPTSRLGLALSWGAIAALFVLILVLLNLVHETGHWSLWKLSKIPSCVYFNEAKPVGGLQLEPRFLWGLAGGPLFNVIADSLLMIPYWRSHSTRGFLIWVITYALMIRPVVMLNHWLFLGADVLPPDEVFLLRELWYVHVRDCRGRRR